MAKLAGETYSSVGAGDKFSSITFPGGHSFPPEMRRQAYELPTLQSYGDGAWLSRWLGGPSANSQARAA